MAVNGKSRAVEVKYASKYSLWVGMDDQPIDPMPIDMELRVDDKRVGLGACRIFPPQGDEQDGKFMRLVSINRFLDFEKLFSRSKVAEVDVSFSKLSLLLSYKESIDGAFRSFVSDLTYDLNVYSNYLDQLDADFADEPEPARQALQAYIISSIGPSLRAYLDEQVLRLENFAAGYSAQEEEHHGFYFRKQLWNVILRSPILARTNLKPRGYNGDSEMMQMIYKDEYQGESTFGRILHKYSIGRPAAQAVRNRRVEVATRLRRYADCHAGDAQDRIRVLSVACGPALEIQDVLRSPEDARRFHFSLLDQDDLALLEVAGLVEKIEDSIGAKVSVDFIQDSVRTMIVSRELKDRWGTFDFIYSMGLFDYLTAPVATAVIKNLYKLLKPDGEMIIGNFASGNPTRYFMEYWHDWKLIYRTEEELLRLASNLPGAATEIATDDTGIQMLLRICKRETDG